jgi:hypothetical protein
MKSPLTPLAALLAVLGLEDLIMIPFMVQSHNQPPVAATILSGVLGAAFLASITGVGRGRRWAYWTAMACLIVNAVNSALATMAGPEALFKAGGAAGLVLSVAAIVLLVRLSPRRAARAASATSAADAANTAHATRAA